MNGSPVTLAHGREVIKMNSDNILDSVKKSIGIAPDYHPFDDELVMDINTILGVLNQLGVGKLGYTISLDSEDPEKESTGSWSEFLTNETAKGITLSEVKTYVAKRVQILFDPPSSGIYMDALKQVISELEFRMNVAVETPIEEGV